jgi:bifunctional non-homologous end joining protein LigD
MLATLIDAPFDNKDWVFESKWDGFRLVAKIEKGRVTLYSRSGLIVSDNYKPIAKALEKVKKDAVIDGELVALDERGVSRFQLLQNALNASANLHYCAFDIMFHAGEDLRGLSLVDRKERLKSVLPKSPLIIYSEHWAEHGTRLFKKAEKLGLEGIMAKRAKSTYLSGARSKDWLKIKTARRQEAVIVGFTAPRRSRPYFGALVLAVREGAAWRYIGHVGTGFSHAMLQELHGKLLPLRVPSSPFKQRIKAKAETTWVKPKLVAEVRFTEWTSDGEMRHPAFLGLREDKKPTDVILEKEEHRAATKR